MIDPIIRLLLIDSGQILPNEKFYQMEEFPKYLISPLAKIYGIKSKKILKQQINQGTNYFYISLLTKSSKRRTRPVHRLVAETFVPNFDNKPQVNHKDGNPHNNIFSNLEWVTGKENIQHAIDIGKYNGQYNKNNPPQD